jgi:hypothetical protein
MANSAEALEGKGRVKDGKYNLYLNIDRVTMNRDNLRILSLNFFYIVFK